MTVLAVCSLGNLMDSLHNQRRGVYFLNISEFKAVSQPVMSLYLSFFLTRTQHAPSHSLFSLFPFSFNVLYFLHTA